MVEIEIQAEFRKRCISHDLWVFYFLRFPDRLTVKQLSKVKTVLE